jgi:WD40 repeat protein/tRNA A-37 threonylcarbamoyl transferase component Bud32
MSSEADHNLLFGVVALQLDFIDRDQLIAGLNAWAVRKSDSLAQVLVDQGALSDARRVLLDPLVAEHVRLHDGDPERSLAAFGALMSSVVTAPSVCDPDIASAIATLTRPPDVAADADPYRTSTYAVRPHHATRFRVLRRHAKGGIGIVFVAHDVELDREVALKEIQDHCADDPASRARFEAEARVTGVLEHPGIVPVYGLGHHADGRPFYAMRLVKGESFKAAIERFHRADNSAEWSGERALELRGLLRRFVDVCEAVQFAHDRGVLHRDLKPGNVMVGRYGETLVVDWGLAKVIGQPEAGGFAGAGGAHPRITGSGSATLPGSVLGTPAYMSPEQAEGRLSDLGPASDVYSLGATLFALLAGKAPFEDGDLSRVAAGDFAPPRCVNPAVPPPLDAVCMKAMRRLPADRYTSASALAAEIERWMADEPVDAAPEGLSLRLARWTRKHRSGVQAGAAALMAVAIVAVLGMIVVDGARRRERAQKQVALVQKIKADRERDRADRERGRADRERDEVKRQSTLLRRQTAELLLDRGLAECADGAIARGLHWMVRALDEAPTRDGLVPELIRANLGSWSRQVAWLDQQLPHQGWVETVAISADGRIALTGSNDGTARLWEVATGRSLGPPLAHRDAVRAVAFSPDGRTALTGSYDHTARLWDVATGLARGAPLAHGGNVTTVAFSPDGQMALTGSNDTTAGLWDAGSGASLRTLVGHRGPVRAVAFSPDGRVIVTGAADGTARLWDTATGRPLGRPLTHGGPVRGVAFSPDGRTVITGSDDSTAALWDALTAERRAAALAHRGPVRAVAFSPDGRVALSGGDDGVPRLWDAANGRPLGHGPEHRGQIRSLAFSPDGTQAITASSDNTARLWDTASGRPIGAPLEHPAWVPAVAFSPDGTVVLTGCGDNTARLWTIPALAPDLVLPHDDVVRAVAFDVRGRVIATAGADARARLWDAASGRLLGPPLEHRGPVRALVFSPDGRSLVTGSDDGTARLWDVVTAAPRGPAMAHRGAVQAVAFSPDGRFVMTGSADRTARLWDARIAQPIGPPLKHDGPVRTVAIAPDSLTAVSAGDDNVARRWDAATCQPIEPPLAHKDQVLATSFSSDGRLVLTASADTTGRLWDAATGRAVGMPLEHRAWVSAAAFRPGGALLATASGDYTARFWDVQTGRPRGAPLEHRGPVPALAFSHDGLLLATGSVDATVRLWRVAAARAWGAPLPHQGAVRALAFHPEASALLSAGADNAARLWTFDSPIEGEPSQLRTWVGILTGFELDDEGGLHCTDANRWRDARERTFMAGQTGTILPRASGLTHAQHRVLALEAVVRRNWFAAAWHLDRAQPANGQAVPLVGDDADLRQQIARGAQPTRPPSLPEDPFAR